jgi:hypothetical protein
MKDYRAAESRYAAPSAAVAALLAKGEAMADQERAERYAGLLKIERGPAAFRITLPRLGDPDHATRRAAFRECRPILADVKAILGRRWDSVQAAWIVPLDQVSSVEILARDYGAEIEPAALDTGTDSRIADLERQVATLAAERDAAVALSDQYAAMLDRQAVAA